MTRGFFIERAYMPEIIDLTGRTFGRLTVLYRGVNKDRCVMWICQCECSADAKITVRGTALRRGVTRSCGCLRSEKNRSRGVDLTGMEFGKWRVLHEASTRGLHRYWLCECTCEKRSLSEVSGTSLCSGLSRSCGCQKVKTVEPVSVRWAA